MMKKLMKLLSIILGIIIIIMIFIFSINSLGVSEDNKENKVVIQEININDNKLKVIYLDGNKIDDQLSYGNTSNYEIKIENPNKNKVSFAIYLDEKNISNDLVTYDISYKVEKDHSYDSISKNNQINDNILLYNITIEENDILYLNITFKANQEGMNTSLKGTLRIDNNVSESEVFNQGIHSLQNNIEKKLMSLNGISESAYYTLNIKDFTDSTTANYKGVVFIDALDLTNLKYFYMVYNDKYMVNDYLYSEEMIKKDVLKKYDANVTKEFSEENICKKHTKKECLPFSSIKYNEKGDKAAFIDDFNKVLDKVKEVHHYNDKRVYIYDVTKDISNDTNIRGYILIDNNKQEYYIYLTNELYMISGYNITKYGNPSSTSTALRTYNETSFRLSAKDESTVCHFTGFKECFNSKNKKI